MERLEDLSRRELLALKEIRLKNRATDRALALQLLKDDLIIGSPSGYLKLTKGRRMLVRGSPSLWDMAS